ncbi:hypothetical protein [Massilia sp. TN1-12]|uniref:hypothetical protein n=1 Tax=Massilia paldalensis TaxID=3377675 RepID=UPI00384C5B05
MLLWTGAAVVHPGADCAPQHESFLLLFDYASSCFDAAHNTTAFLCAISIKTSIFGIFVGADTTLSSVRTRRPRNETAC